jgi:hypothetical protein
MHGGKRLLSRKVNNPGNKGLNKSQFHFNKLSLDDDEKIV